MRLICPNCDAQYEVPIEVMPPEGRDVQCSSCGQTWFQDHPDHPTAAESDADTDPSEEDDRDSAGTATQVATDSESASEQEEGADHPENPGIEPSIPGRRELDPAVADVLRAEAELEAEARRKESGGLESQPDLGLAEASPFPINPGQHTKERSAVTHGDYFEDEDDELEELILPATSTVGSPRAELPDVDDINSTMRSDHDRIPEPDPEELEELDEREKRNSRLGFVLSIALFAVLALLYAFAPAVVETLPQVAPALDAYVSTVDAGMHWLDSKVASALSWLDQAATASE